MRRLHRLEALLTKVRRRRAEQLLSPQALRSAAAEHKRGGGLPDNSLQASFLTLVEKAGVAMGSALPVDPSEADNADCQRYIDEADEAFREYTRQRVLRGLPRVLGNGALP